MRMRSLAPEWRHSRVSKVTLISVLDHAAVFVFALTGALTASRAQLDVVGFTFMACITAVGGGTVRDILLNRTPVWMDQPSFLGLAVLAAVLVFFTAHLLESRLKTIEWLDALALGSAVAAGVGVALNMDQPWPIVLVMGIATSCLGGLMRDVVSNEVPLVLKQGELYVTCAVAGAGATLIALECGMPQTSALLLCAAVTLLLRAGSLLFAWKLPVYRSRPPRA